MVYEGLEPERIPVHFETIEKTLEAALGDILLGHAWVPRWGRFFDEGGPFKRGNRSLKEWAEELDIEEGYDWPSVDDIVRETVDGFRRSLEGLMEVGKFVIFEVIGPTEQSEYFLCPQKPPSGFSLDLAYHLFDFGVLTVIEREKARKLYDKIAGYVLELIKAGSEMEWIDAVRVADDAFSYTGHIYPEWFMEELYVPWHRRFTAEIHKRGKYAIIHTDGDVLSRNYLKVLSRIYDGIHPLDLAKKGTVEDAMRWVDRVAEARGSAGDAVFHTGIPIDLMMLDSVSPSDVLLVVSALLRKHGKKNLVLSVTHRPYPRRSFLENHVFEKVRAIRRLVGLPELNVDEWEITP